MLLEVGIIAAGVPVGWALRKRRALVRLTDTVMTWSIRFLLLFLGLGLGGNELLMSQIESLGTRGAVIALAAVFGSLGAARILEPFLHLPPTSFASPARDDLHPDADKDRRGPTGDAVLSARCPVKTPARDKDCG